MAAFSALRRTLGSLWDDSLLLVTAGLVGGLMSALILPLPLAMAAHYGTGFRAARGEFVTWRSWLVDSRNHLGFFFKWVVLFLVTVVIFVANLLFYSQLPSQVGSVMRVLMAGLLLLWLLPQPYVPALYLVQQDKRLRTALRNAAVLVIQDPGAALLLWISTLLLGVLLGFIGWPLLFLLQIYIPLFASHVVRIHVSEEKA